MKLTTSLTAAATVLLSSAPNFSDAAPINAQPQEPRPNSTKIQRPNIIYILADDMGYGDVSSLNPQSKIRTPNLDQLASHGISFTDAHSSSAVCTPSRYSILTGRYNWRSALKERVLFGYDTHLIEPHRMTVASLLQQNGYHTACIGKWHLGWDWAKKSAAAEDIDFTRPIQNGPCNYGFDYFYGIIGSLDMPPYVYVENDRITALPNRTVKATTGKGFYRSGPTGADFIHEQTLPNFTKRAVTYIETQMKKHQPYFLYFPLTAPHTPILPMPEFQGKSQTNEYGDFCLMVDDIVGKITQKVREYGQENNTIIVFTSDNGCSPLADFAELQSEGHNPSYIFRGMKSDIFEGGHRIPLIIQYPNLIPAASTCSETVCLVDFFATVADLLNLKYPDSAAEDSISNLAIWQGKKQTVRSATVHHSIDGSFALRMGKWKLNLCPGSGGWTLPNQQCVGMPQVQLYDMSQDCGETRNIYDQYPEVVKQMTDLLAAYVRNGRSTPGLPQKNTAPEWWKQLEWMKENAQ